MPTIDVLLHGHSFRVSDGIFGFCSVSLVEGRYRTLVDVGHVGRRNALLAALKERGLTPADIDYVFVTHVHWEHVQNLDSFPDATVLIHPWERRYAQKPHVNDWATPAWTGAMIEHQAHIQEVDEGFVLEDGFTVAHTPGHSPGSIVAMVDTDDGRCALTGDVLHVARAALTRRNPSIFWNEEQAAQAIDRVVTEADVIYPGHDRPFRVVDGEIVYEVPFQLAFRALDPDAEGVSFEAAGGEQFVMPGIEEQREDQVRS